jgi:hypothetical protein
MKYQAKGSNFYTIVFYIPESIHRKESYKIFYREKRGNIATVFINFAAAHKS